MLTATEIKYRLAEQAPQTLRIEQFTAPLVEAMFVCIYADLEQDDAALRRWEDEGGRYDAA